MAKIKGDPDKFFEKWRYSRDGKTPNKVTLGVLGITAIMGANGEISFSVRQRGVPGKGKNTRPRKNIGYFRPGPPGSPPVFGFGHAIAAAHAQRQVWQDMKDGKTLFDPTTVPTFDAFIDEYERERTRRNPLALPKGKNKWKEGMPVRWEQDKHMLRLVYKDVLGKQMHIITRNELNDCQLKYLDEREAKKDKRPFTSIRATLTTLRSMTDTYALRMNYVKGGLLDGLSSGGTKEESRERFVLPREWQQSCPALDGLGEHRGLLPRFWFATAARFSMPFTMYWRDLKVRNVGTLDDPQMLMVWCVPAEHMKSGYEALFPIVGKSLEIVEQCRAIAGGTPDPNSLVFPKKAIKAWSGNRTYWQKAVYKASGTSGWTRHDLRRTMASMLYKFGANEADVKRLLAHDDGDRSATKIYLVLERELKPLGVLAKHLERMHVLLDDIERGRVTRDVRQLYLHIEGSFTGEAFKHKFGIDPDEWKEIKADHTLPTAKVQELRPHG